MVMVCPFHVFRSSLSLELFHSARRFQEVIFLLSINLIDMTDSLWLCSVGQLCSSVVIGGGELVYALSALIGWIMIASPAV